MKQYIDIIEQHLASYNFGTAPVELYEPIRYILSLGGKRIRPVLTLMTYELFNDHLDDAIYPALGVEVFHNFTLMHDDIMDNAPLRRGRQTVHEKWDDNIAILSGDVMLVRAYELMAKAKTSDLHLVMKKFSQCAAQVCEGQQYDMNFELEETISEAQYLEMIKMKTAVLLAFSMELGGILADGQSELTNLLYDLGINIGLGFQLKDDLLDVYADSAKFGKQVGGDIISNKKTFLLIKAIEQANGSLKSKLDYWLNAKQFDPSEKVAEVKQIYDQLGIKEVSEDKMNEYFDRGRQIFEEVTLPDYKLAPLRQLINLLIDREK